MSLGAETIFFNYPDTNMLWIIKKRAVKSLELQGNIFASLTVHSQADTALKDRSTVTVAP